jgi:hypothetical protein
MICVSCRRLIVLKTRADERSPPEVAGQQRKKKSGRHEREQEYKTPVTGYQEQQLEEKMN